MNDQLTPDTIIDTDDRGDDTQRRFRYQAIYAANTSLSLLLPEPPKEMYCEHHDDVLLKLSDETWMAIQVKSRDTGLEPFRSTDAPMLQALVKFVSLEQRFPGTFSRFMIACNCGFWRAKPNYLNLAYVIAEASNGSEAGKKDLDKLVGNLITKSTLDSKPASHNLVTSVLRKVHLDDNLPKLDEPELWLAKQISTMLNQANQPLARLHVAAESLTNLMLKAASLKTNDLPSVCVTLSDNPANAKEMAIIDGKKISADLVLATINAALADEALLSAKRRSLISQIPKTASIMTTKLIAGDISSDNIDLLKDLKYSAEVKAITWLEKYNSCRADRQYNHIRLLVQNTCQEAYDSALQTGKVFGPEMLANVRASLKLRYADDRDVFLGCKYEHLLGFAGILTEDCTIWWSKDRPDVMMDQAE